MQSTATHTSSDRVSRRGLHEAQSARVLSSVAPCLHTALHRDDSSR